MSMSEKAFDATDLTKEICDDLKTEIEHRLHTECSELSPIKYKIQNARSGAYYFIKVKTGRNQYIHVKAFNSFDNSRQLTAVIGEKERDDPIDYF